LIIDGLRFAVSHPCHAEEIRGKDGHWASAAIEAESAVADLPEQVERMASRTRVRLREAEQWRAAMALAARWLFRVLLWQEPVLARQSREQRRVQGLRRGLQERHRGRRRDWEAHRAS
jgi:hypothetical protein